MSTIPTAAPEINAAQDPVQTQGRAGESTGTNPADGLKFDSVMKSEDTALKDNETGVQDSETGVQGSETGLQDSLQGEDIPKPVVQLNALPEVFLIAADTGTSASPGGEVLQTKNGPQTIQLPASGSPGEMVNTKVPALEINQAPEETTVLSILKDQERVANISDEREDLVMAFRDMVGKGGKEIKNFVPNNVEKTAGETIFKSQTDIALKHSEQTGRVIEIENTNPGNGSAITSGGQKSVDKPFLETVQRPSGFNEVLDKIVYVIKNNRSMDVSVLHEGNRLKLSLTMNKGMVNVHINTNEAAMRELIESNIQNIVDSLEKDGVNISEFSVNLKDRQHDHNRENTFNHDMPVRGFTPPAHISSVNSGTGVVNIFV